MIVVKFGGTSVADSSAIKKVTNTVISQKNHKQLVVLSACSGITNKLIECSELAAKSGFKKSENVFLKIQKHHFDLLNELFEDDIQIKIKTKNQLEIYFKELKDFLTGIGLLKELSDQIYAKILSLGEILSTTIFEAYISQFTNSKWIKSIDFIKTDNNFKEATVDFDSTNALLNERLLPLFDEFDVIVAQGFIGSDKNNVLTLLGRGGSDYSAAIYGAGLNADDIQIWTDVSGVMSADPRFFSDAKTIQMMSSMEIAELSFFGAKVIHPLTILPAMNKNIKVTVRNTFNPESEFTTIMNNYEGEAGFHSIIQLNKCNLIEGFDENYLNIIANLKKLNFKILNVNIQNNRIRILIAENKNQDLYQDFDLISENIDCIIISGHNLHRIANELFRELLLEIEEDIQVISHNNNSIILKLQSQNAYQIAKKIHNSIINNF